MTDSGAALSVRATRIDAVSHTGGSKQHLAHGRGSQLLRVFGDMDMT